MGFRRTQGDGVPPRVALRTQGGASLYPGLSHFAPLGRGDDGPSYEVRWRFEPTRWTGSAGSLNETRWSYAPTGRKGIAQGKAKRRPGILLEPIIPILEQSLRFSMADFVDSIVGHADPWKLRWFLSRFSTSNCTFDDIPQGISGAIKKRGGFQPFRELGRVAGRRNRMEIPRRKIPTHLRTGGG